MKKLFSAPSIQWQSKFKTLAGRAQDERLQSFYAKGLPDSETPLKDVSFVALDFETTGLNPEKDGILSIGLVPFTTSRIRINAAKHWTVRPKAILEEESVVIHGITHNDILDAPKFKDILGDVLDSLAGHIIVVHYNPIERGFFDDALKGMIGEGIEFPVVDTMQIESIYQKRVTAGVINMLKGKQADSVRLGQTRRRYGLPDYPPHHALTDAVATAELLQAQLAYHYDENAVLNDIWI
ncbi:3'-5' exonuclease [Vibrio methylphosphonaticus]|uniref:3'-5' exonuclease n=1 Tax=Vibrio methylphosphonaticus TaxID=2946866 RepID=UPI002029CD86|nr:3'-5' exonuclease [Vibrio methylphosphonaticus]MCL9775839.1 3'-5' exonuclease [Vibrio methylphosphonaticus]